MMSGPLVQAELAGGRGGPAAAGDAELAGNAGHVHADGLHGDEQFSRDLAVAPADRDEPGHLELAGGEAPVPAVAGWPGSAILARRASWAICLASGRVPRSVPQQVGRVGAAAVPECQRRVGSIDAHRTRSQVAIVAEDGQVQLNKNVVNGSEPMLRLIGELPTGTPVAFEAAFGWGWPVPLIIVR
jgi:hypothetical protein